GHVFLKSGKDQIQPALLRSSPGSLQTLFVFRRIWSSVLLKLRPVLVAQQSGPCRPRISPSLFPALLRAFHSPLPVSCWQRFGPAPVRSVDCVFRSGRRTTGWPLPALL